MHESLIKQKCELLGSLLLFTQTFYKLRTGRDFKISSPNGRESHHLIIARELVKVFNLETPRLLINVPPGHGKSEMLIHFVAWAMAYYPDSNFLYISYSHELAASHTHTIKQIMELPHYRHLFGVEIRSDSSAKDYFMTTKGGCVAAFGSSGSITGRNAGLPDMNRFSGCVLLDDMHKPIEIHSDTMREGVITNYDQTIKIRPRGLNVPILGIGQCLHEADIWGYLKAGKDGYDWKQVVLPARDNNGNMLWPEVMSLQYFLREEEFNPYVCAAQLQQNPQPSGGGIYKPEWFYLTENESEPDLLATFLTIDTAETDKSYNDATVFSFWGVYRIKHTNIDTKMYGIHWIDCSEIRIEPKDLESEFLFFFSQCMMHKVKPEMVFLEKKSTGITLVSILSRFQGLQIIDIQRTRASGSKTQRFYEAQPYVATKRISLPRYGKHTNMCIEHCRKITANNTHRFDDICDTMYDAIKAALIDEIVLRRTADPAKNEILAKMSDNYKRMEQIRNSAYVRR